MVNNPSIYGPSIPVRTSYDMHALYVHLVQAARPIKQ